MIGRLNMSGVVLLCAVLLGALPAGSASGVDAATAYTPSPTSPFVDVAGTSSDRPHTFYREISWLAERGITTGYGSAPGRRFDPSAPVLREQMAAFLYRLAGEPDVVLPAESPFADVPTSHAFYRAIVWLQSTQVTTGYTGTDGTVTFRGAQPVLREQMAAFLYRFWTWQDDGVKPPVPTGSSFTDVVRDDTFEREIRWLASTGVTTGYAEPGGTRTFRGTLSVLREQMAAFMFRFDSVPRTSMLELDRPGHVMGAGVVSGNGRFVVFSSTLSDLVKGDTNQQRDVFVRDLRNGRTERVSVSSSGQQGNRDSATYGRPDISSDGRYVTFVSEATNLVPGDTNAHIDVFLHDRQTGATERVSVSSTGEQGNRDSAYFGSQVSDDGQVVAFHSTSSNLVPGAPNTGSNQIFVRDRLAGTTTPASVSSTGELSGYFPVGSFDLSANGRHVAFVTQSANVVAGDTNEAEDVFVHDRQTRLTERVSVTSTGEQTPQFDGWSAGVSISADGQRVAFASSSSRLASGIPPGRWQVYVRDRTARSTSMVSVTPTGARSGGAALPFQITSDGQSVVFASGVPDLVPGDVNEQSDVFVRDLEAETTERVSVSTAGAAGVGPYVGGSISDDGRYVVFYGHWTLVPGLAPNASGMWLRDRGWV
ncbi:S-layer homology domain-containing protein [Aeromicrobium sp.]|uniref:S-layer homology domain-containing protein n=1 Tax=Aeromicrobium sp. TaxID=1871063 RepID=UPI0025C04A9A|nr:S-layer homology domain-containing protein [Aeromicrobium sp.]MCK5892491.1 S-layer homology domain-containing protein [Aeromicrobium sp.]